jgi:hypothetical protein
VAERVWDMAQGGPDFKPQWPTSKRNDSNGFSPLNQIRNHMSINKSVNKLKA